MKKQKRMLLLKLKKIFKLGYVPSRENQTYKYIPKHDREVSELVNCFAHACFNLTNKQIEKYSISYDEAQCFWDFPTTYNVEHDLSRIIDFVKKTGLEIHKSSEYKVMQSNQWKIAFYCDPEFGDFHFMLQEKNGLWSSKLGSSRKVQLFQIPPKKFDKIYDLHSFYEITNPYREV